MTNTIFATHQGRYELRSETGAFGINNRGGKWLLNTPIGGTVDVTHILHATNAADLMARIVGFYSAR